MDQNSNYITIEMSCRIQMLCGARHNICYGKRWIMWTVLILKLIPALWHAIAPHNASTAAVKPTDHSAVHSESSASSAGAAH